MLFRAIHVKDDSILSGMMVYGDLIHYAEGKRAIQQIETKSLFTIEDETVGQYWRTVNDQKLFDGDVFDVIVATEGESTYSVRFIAKYQNDEECFQITNLADLHSTLWNFTKRPFAPNSDWWADEKKEIKVLGNIHENPDLLKPKPDEKANPKP